MRAEQSPIAEFDGEPAAMAVTLPNVNEAIADLDGRLLPVRLGEAAVAAQGARPATARMPLMGVRKPLSRHAARRGAGARRDRRRCAAASARGVPSARELSWILEDNMPMRRMIELAGGRPYKTYRIYEKALA